jgi:hypothetical protein
MLVTRANDMVNSSAEFQWQSADKSLKVGLIKTSCVAILLAISHTACADVGVVGPHWNSTPTTFELDHQITVPKITAVRDILRIGNIVDDQATIEIILVRNGNQLYGGAGEAQ